MKPERRRGEERRKWSSFLPVENPKSSGGGGALVKCGSVCFGETGGQEGISGKW